MNATIAIPADGPLFEGHFPGRPILPGIAALVLLARTLAEGCGCADVAAIPFARFRSLVLPRDVLEVVARPRGEGSVRFEAKRSGTVVANGAMTFGIPVLDPGGVTSVASRAARGVPPLDRLIPHRPPMLFVERILGEAEDGATCLGRVPSACALVTGGVAPAFVALEAAAQAAAVWEALCRSRTVGSCETRTGYLVSLRDVVLHRRTIPAEADLIATVRLVAAAPPLTTYDATVTVDGGLALRGTIGTFLSE